MSSQLQHKARLARRRRAQQIRRAIPGAKERQNARERERYAALPKNHPRKNRPDRHTKEAWRRKREKELKQLPDYVVARRYLHLKISECPKDLIDLKREVMRLNAMLGIQTKTL